MLVKDDREMTAECLMEQFPEADLILIEGLKYSHFPKIELVRGIVSQEAVCDPKTVLAYISDVMQENEIPVYRYSQMQEVADVIENFAAEERSNQ